MFQAKGVPSELIAFVVAALAGSINSVAGGGSLLTFPTLIWLGLPSIVANATNTVATWLGSFGAIWGFRRELRVSDPRLLALAVPSFVGGLAGAVLLRLTPTDVFDRLVPALILFATLLFMAQEWVQRRFSTTATPGGSSARVAGVMLFQFLVGVYGGYFGAGIGILMLAALALIGLSDIYQMTAIKNLLAVVINGVAAIYFIYAGLVSWPEAVTMAAGGMVGNLAGAGVSRRLGRQALRRMVVAIGFAMTLSLLIKR